MPVTDMIARATESFRRHADTRNGATSEEVDKACFRTELDRISAELRHLRFANSSSVGITSSDDNCHLSSRTNRNDSRYASANVSSSLFVPALYLRERDPAAEQVRQSLRSAVKSVELYLRCHEIEKLDIVHGKLWDLLCRDGRDRVTVEEYKEVMRHFDAWYTATWVGEQATTPAIAHVEDEPSSYVKMPSVDVDTTRLEPNGDVTSVQQEPHRTQADTHDRHSVRCTSSAAMSTTQWLRCMCDADERCKPTLCSDTAGSSQVDFNNTNTTSPRRSQRDGVCVGKVLYLPCVPSPRLTMELYLSCARSVSSADLTGAATSADAATSTPTVAATQIVDSVDIASIYHAFAKRVSLVKCEAELMMWDMNNDGKLTEGDLEGYICDLVPRIAALHTLTDDVLLFYCCTASRRIMWDLDPNNRGTLRIDALLRSAVMEEWLNLQLATEDNLQNWFGVSVTRFIVEKFVLLDTHNVGTLTVENLSHYKKGLPVVTDDGLPPDVSPLCSLFIDRFFETNLMTQTAEMDFRKFTDFVIAVEMLPQCSRPLFFWNILDLHSTGVLTPLTVNYFFRETHAKLVSVGLDAPSREIVVQEVFDLIATARPLLITRDEFVQSPQAGLFTSLLIDCLSFWSYENREQRGL